MMKGGSCQHEPVDKCDGDASGGAGCDAVQHSVSFRPVKIEAVLDPNVDGRQHKRMSPIDESDMANQRLIQHIVDHLPIVNAVFSPSWPVVKNFLLFWGHNL